MKHDFADHLRRYGPGANAGSPSLPQARAYCRQLALTHYENFLVGSFLLPRRLVPHFHALYAYCRWADDLADEVADPVEALALLAWWRGELLQLYAGRTRHPVMVALAETVREFDLPAEPFLDLLVAFEQDQRVRGYATFAELLGYCRYSANPVGRLVLGLFRCATPDRIARSDAICTGLQLANFWQDVARDAAKGRVYLPAADVERFGCTLEAIRSGPFTPALGELMRFEVARARSFLQAGAPLVDQVPEAARVDVALFVAGGHAVLDAIERQGGDVWQRRPTVSKAVQARLLLGALVRHKLGLGGWRRPTLVVPPWPADAPVPSMLPSGSCLPPRAGP
ncbi:MAG TPA: squalene synthase HpnC [Gemmatales bacterium]|nr:squalene synthase HpnC [Gemmatales bacterium]HMP61009.1 squalene synthase HpnC [Gemmatales bacterium]